MSAEKLSNPFMATIADPKERRLLICEVLIEEYESLAQPQIDFTSIKSEIAKFRAECEKLDNDELVKREYELNDRMLKRIYSLMAKAQSNAANEFAEAEFQSRRNVLAENFKNLSPDELHRVAERGVAAQIYGHIAELRSKFTGQFIDVTDEQKRDAMVEQAILDSLVKEALDPPSKKGEANGGDKPKKGEGISRKQAERVQAGTLRSALCLSGGGIRSATFNLGILQGLARHGLLERFDYLSTVSGGGFIGGWLSAWICRQGMSTVMDQLKIRANPMQPDPKPVEHLRVYSNYLSPKPGLLSADSWTLVASVLRNLLLTWLVFLPVLALFLLLPRIWTSILLRSFMHTKYSIPISLIVACLSGMCAMIYTGLSLPSANASESPTETDPYKVRQGRFIVRSLVWLVISAAAFSIFSWAAANAGLAVLRWLSFYLVVISIVIGPGWITCLIKTIQSTKPEKRNRNLFGALTGATVLIGIAVLIISFMARFASHSFLPGSEPNDLVYSIFSVPLVLVMMMLTGALIAGLTSRFAKDDDQEWWARAGAWVFIVIVGWTLIHILVLYGPLLLLTLVVTLKKVYTTGLRTLKWGDIGTIAGTALGIVSGIITLIGGFSARTPANAKEAQRVGVAGKSLSLLTSIVAPIFLAFVFIVISLGTDFLLVSPLGQLLSRALGGPNLPFPTEATLYASWHLTLLKETPFRLIVLLCAAIIVLVYIIGPFISTNAFSLQFMWRNRIIRAYLGASREKRNPNEFTGFDTFDNLQMFELRKQPGDDNRALRAGRPPDDIQAEPPRKLLHILNLALNLTGGEKLQWQDRRAESCTVSPLHTGSYWLGYRRSSHFGGPEGISLGHAIAISGAFVSPNMGYMMTSPVVRFLMALFNVRFGAWLGNPGPAGDKPDLLERLLSIPLRLFGFRVGRPFLLGSPSLSVLPFISEAFGDIDDKSPYVYLSDGGHFENLGLYEMVLRRCRFIVVSDASTDPDYAFQSLAMSIRQIRVDLGVPIELPELSISAPTQDLKNKYCAIGTIRYSCVDRDPQDYTTRDKDFDGVLIYLKPSLIGEEPRDVVNYWQGSNAFPQEVITDQWFSEAQFESYRALGSHMIDTICGGESSNPINLAAFATRVRDHNEIDFRSFREKISYLALEEVFKEGMKQESIDSFRMKVRRFAERIFRS